MTNTMQHGLCPNPLWCCISINLSNFVFLSYISLSKIQRNHVIVFLKLMTFMLLKSGNSFVYQIRHGMVCVQILSGVALFVSKSFLVLHINQFDNFFFFISYISLSKIQRNHVVVFLKLMTFMLLKSGNIFVYQIRHSTVCVQILSSVALFVSKSSLVLHINQFV